MNDVAVQRTQQLPAPVPFVRDRNSGEVEGSLRTR